MDFRTVGELRGDIVEFDIDGDEGGDDMDEFWGLSFVTLVLRFRFLGSFLLVHDAANASINISLSCKNAAEKEKRLF